MNEAFQLRLSRWRSRAQEAWDWLGGVIYGMTMFEVVRHFRRQRANREHLFVLISFGDLMGVPILPPYYTLRLLPYVVPLINTWKLRMLRERDLTDLTADLG
jgi:hypothetical protein